MMPVDFVCKANNFEDFKKYAQPVIERYLPMKDVNPDGPQVLWCLEFRKRNNDKIMRNTYLNYITEMTDSGRLSLSNDYADIEVIVEVFRDILVCSAIPGFKKHFKKYNLQMLAGQDGAVSDQEQEVKKTVNVADLIKMR